VHTTRKHSPAFSRRALLAGIAGSAATAILAACGGSKATSTPATSGAATTATGAGATATGAVTTAATRATGSTTAAATTATGASTTAASTTSAGSAVAGNASGTTAATSGSAPAGTTTSAAQYTETNLPAVANAAEAKKYAGAKLVFSGGHNPPGSIDDDNRAKKFSQETGVNVQYTAGADSTTDRYSEYQRFFQGKSSDLDLLQIDVIFPAAFAQNLVDLGPKLGDVAKQHFQNIIQNNTVDGKLVGLPYAGDFGLLFYRKDLLQKYGFNAPPKTWDELEQQANKIMAGEKASNPNFVGFVFQGNAYEGLTCDALEWFQSNGAGGFIDDGKVTINNDKGIAFMNKMRGWVGTIAPKGVTSFKEEDARNVFQGGNAAFMRNWPYAYSLGNQPDSPIKGKFDVTPLPAGDGQKPVGTVGGWQMGVSKYSKSPDAAIEFVRYYCSPEMQTWSAVVRQNVPTIQSVSQNPVVIEADPFLRNVTDVQRVTRPSLGLGENYNEGSTAIYQGINQILNGQDAKSVLPDVESKLKRLLRSR